MNEEEMAVDLSGPVQLEDREGVFAHSYRCFECRLHFVLFSWRAHRHTGTNVNCPECGNRSSFLHFRAVLSTSRDFELYGEGEIFQVWPFPGSGPALA